MTSDPSWEQTPELQGPQVTSKLRKNSMHSVLVGGGGSKGCLGFLANSDQESLIMLGLGRE